MRRTHARMNPIETMKVLRKILRVRFLRYEERRFWMQRCKVYGNKAIFNPSASPRLISSRVSSLITSDAICLLITTHPPNSSAHTDAPLMLSFSTFLPRGSSQQLRPLLGCSLILRSVQFDIDLAAVV